MKFEDWTPSLVDYEPNITKDDWLRFLNEKVKDNQKMLIALARIMDNGGEFICKETANKYGDNMTLFRNFITTDFGKYAFDYFNVPAWEIEVEKARNWSIFSQIKSCTNKEIGSFRFRLRNNLQEALKEFGISNYFSYGAQDVSCIIANLSWNSNGWKGPSDDKTNFGYVKNGNVGHESWNFDFDNPRNIDGKIFGFIQLHGAPKTWEASTHLVIMSSNNLIVGAYGKALVLKKPEKIDDDLEYNICGLKDYCVYFQNPIDNKNKAYLEGGERIGQGGFNYLYDKKNILNILNEAKKLNPNESKKIDKLIEWVTENRIIEKNKKDTMESSNSGKSTMADSKISLNQILYGPPGTGKTYITKEMAVRICDAAYYEQNKDNRDSIIKKYNELVSEKRIAFTTFHQSLGYEDFIEGIKPVIEENSTELKYEIKPGIFKDICQRALTTSTISNSEDLFAGLNDNPTVWKVSLEGTGDNPTRKDCLENGYIRLGWSGYGDVNFEEYDNYTDGGKAILRTFQSGMQIGDIVISCYSANETDAIGIVTGDYYYDEKGKSYPRYRNVKWLVKNVREDIREKNNNKAMTLASVYKLSLTADDALSIVKKLTKVPESTDSGVKPYLLIIDEINRGNVAQIFGELITLIEESKRKDAYDEQSCILPYSQKPFAVPSNLYILGTMNTADRSIEALDTALRRRFSFVPMMPQPEILQPVGDIDLSVMLTVINERIENLLDKDHTIGHAYFMKADNQPLTLEDLCSVFANKVIPQLQEYFYNDMKKIQMILGEDFISKKEPKKDLFKVSNDSYFNEKEVFEITSPESWDEKAFVGIYN